MSSEKARALVIRNADWSETSRISTLWTRELGKVRCLAKGGRRLKSNFESALDLITVCDIVFIRKSSASLDILTEARVAERFPRLRADLPSLYAAYYVAELLGDWTQDYDPHPVLFDEAVETLRRLGQAGVLAGPCVARFELVFLRELGYGPALESCAVCAAPLAAPSLLPLSPEAGDTGSGEKEGGLAFSAAAGGVVCPACQRGQRDRRPLTVAAWQALSQLGERPDAWREFADAGVRRDVRQVLDDYVTYLSGRRPRLLPYLGS
jgi:DNA repair protein RecO (recombination protein O)